MSQNEFRKIRHHQLQIRKELLDKLNKPHTEYRTSNVDIVIYLALTVGVIVILYTTNRIVQDWHANTLRTTQEYAQVFCVLDAIPFFTLIGAFIYKAQMKKKKPTAAVKAKP